MAESKKLYHLRQREKLMVNRLEGLRKQISLLEEGFISHTKTKREMELEVAALVNQLEKSVPFLNHEINDHSELVIEDSDHTFMITYNTMRALTFQWIYANIWKGTFSGMSKAIFDAAVPGSKKKAWTEGGVSRMLTREVDEKVKDLVFNYIAKCTKK